MTALTKHVSVTMLATWLVFSTVLLPTTTAYAAPVKSTSNSGKHLGQEKRLAPDTPQDTHVEGSAQNSVDVQVPHGSDAQGRTSSTSTTVAAAAQAKSDPAGNNGTVKVDRAPFDSHPDNQPHVTCSFQIDFYGFDKGVGNADVNFALQNPTFKGRTLTVTTGDLTPNIGEDAAGGGTDLDASETYTLAFTGDAHEKQGYHVKLTVHAPGSQGSDVKHKVFWVEGCEEPTTPTTPTEGGQVLGEAASTTRPAVLPASLPSTGDGNALFNLLVAVVAGTLTYAQLRRRQNTSLVEDTATNL